MKAWEDFLSGRSDAGLAARDVVVHSWKRCLDAHIDPRADAAPSVCQDDIELLRRRNRDLLQAASGVLAEAANLLAGTGSLMLITDAAGVVIEAVGDRRTISAGRDIALGHGGQWQENSAGTNGIGTALATGVPMLVHAAEHYCEGIKKWSCAGAPIRDPVDGSIVGVLDISGLKQTFSSQALAFAVVAARQIERELAQQTEAEHLRLLEMCLEEYPKYATDGLIALDAKARILHVSKRASQLLKGRLGAGIADLGRGARIANLEEPGAAREGGVDLSSRVPRDWIKPLILDGERRGTLLVIPGSSSPGRGTPRTRAVPDEADHARAGFDRIIGASPSMLAVLDQARRLAPLRVPVLIEGETGVGKELFARALHGHSDVAGGPFVPFNCGAVSREMLASELFGYVRGAFTGASNEGRMGRFELADGGTLCLDEIGELPLDLQPYLLRVLEEGIVYRVGDNTPRRVDVRLVAMTNRNLRHEIEAGRFRRDLYHRLGVTGLRIPPLRERTGDVDLLLATFNETLAERHGKDPVRFTAAAMDALHRYAWPGNVRELRNLVERSILLSTGAPVDVGDLPEDMRDAVGDRSGGPLIGSPAGAPVGAMSLESTERQAIERAIANAKGNMTDAAHSLGISRSTLYRKLRQYGIDRVPL